MYYRFLAGMYKMGRVTAAQVWAAAASGMLTEAQAEAIAGPKA